MPEIQKAVVIGGDMRQIYLAEALAKAGVEADTYLLELADEHPTGQAISSAAQLKKYDLVLLPLPLTKDGQTVNAPLSCQKAAVSEIFKYIGSGAAVFGGRITDDVHAEAQKCGVELLDYSVREEFEVLNAVLTAEATLSLAAAELRRSLFGMHVLILGYGRIGKMLSHMLKPVGAIVTAAARKPKDRAWARAYGCRAISFNDLKAEATKFPLIINTVPSLVLDRDILAGLQKDCFVIDLASVPGGVDFSAATELGVKCTWALALPGRYSPQTAAEIVCETVLNILEERGWLGGK